MTKLNQNIHRFGESERLGVYRAIYERRDIRSSFTPTPIEDEVLVRLLDAAHHAPSVGLMQPWGFILIRDAGVRQGVYEIFKRACQSGFVNLRAPRTNAQAPTSNLSIARNAR